MGANGWRFRDIPTLGIDALRLGHCPSRFIEQDAHHDIRLTQLSQFVFALFRPCTHRLEYRVFRIEAQLPFQVVAVAGFRHGFDIRSRISACSRPTLSTATNRAEPDAEEAGRKSSAVVASRLLSRLKDTEIE